MKSEIILAFTSQDILANGACDLVHAGKITEDDLGLPEETFIKNVQIQVDIRQGNLIELFNSLARQRRKSLQTSSLQSASGWA